MKYYTRSWKITKWMVDGVPDTVLKMGWKSPSRVSLSGWLMKYYIRSWIITKWMVDGVPHMVLKMGWKSPSWGSLSGWLMKYMRIGLWNFDKYTVRPRIIEGVDIGILAIASSFGHYRSLIHCISYRRLFKLLIDVEQIAHAFLEQ